MSAAGSRDGAGAPIEDLVEDLDERTVRRVLAPAAEAQVAVVGK